MTEPRVRSSRSLAQIMGAEETRKAGQPDTLAEYVVTLARANPNGVFTEIGFDGGERSRTYGELFEDASKLSAATRELRPKAGEFAVLCFETAIDYIPAAWACLLNGFSFLPLSISQFYRNRDQLIHRTQRMMGTLGVSLVLTEARFKEVLSNTLKKDPRASILDTKHVLASPHEAVGDVGASFSPSDILIETSGTTGRPKLACLGGDKIINRLFDGVGPDQRISLNLLVHHSVGGLRLLLPIGRQTVYLNPSRMMANPEAWLDCVSRFRVTDAGMSCGMAAKINESIDRGSGGWDVSSLERLAFGSETIAPTIIRRLISNLQTLGMRDATAFLVYSMTETGPLFFSRLPARDLLDAGLESNSRFRLTRCADSWSVRIVRETGEVASKGEIGRIEVRSETRMFRGYHSSGVGPSANGWFDTGDLGLLDDQGLFLTGREKSTISINGRKISCEDVEACLTQVDGIKPGLIVAAPFRGEASSTDELAVFFTPEAFDDGYLVPLVPKIHSAVSKALGVRISHLVPIGEEHIERTASGKIKRSVLVDGLRLGLWGTLKLGSKRQGHGSESLSWLTRQWKEILKLEFDPGIDQNFFDLGGDSLASAEMLFAVEDKYHCRLSLEKFFENPTLSTMAGLICTSTTDSASIKRHKGTKDTHGLLHKLQSFSGSWQGQRLFSDSLLVGFNTDGSRPPIFWVLQEYLEASQLAKYLGPDQPFYAMRSCVGIIKGQEDYTADVLETVCNRYLWEMLALPVGDAFVMGGNCQGGILALAMARRLKQIGRAPALLALLEWSFSYGSYTEPALLIYGEESNTAKIYRQPETSRINWRNDFSRSVVASVPGIHGELFREESVACLAKILSEHAGHYLSIQPVERREGQIASQAEELAEKTSRILELQKEVEDRSAWALKLDQELTKKTDRILELQKEVEDRSAWALRIQDAVNRAEARACKAEVWVASLLNSRSWRITGALRSMSSVLNKLSKALARSPAESSKADRRTQIHGAEASALPGTLQPFDIEKAGD
jgi:acyl-CoA synthetase (AMP-forming)/AMP-acid ligase II/acyl carrier protein